MSFHSLDSDVTRLNRAAASRPVQVNAHTASVLRHAAQISLMSDGVFDVTVAPVLVDLKHLPQRPDLPPPDPKGSWRDIRVSSANEVSYSRQVWVDLGGIAKGYAVDCAISAMQQLQGPAAGPDHSIMVNAGGEVRISGQRRAEVLLRKFYKANEKVAVLAIENCSLASSYGADPQNGMQNKPSPHIDGETRGINNIGRFVSVVGKLCVVADALTKVVMARGECAAMILRHFSSVAYVHDQSRGWYSIGYG